MERTAQLTHDTDKHRQKRSIDVLKWTTAIKGLLELKGLVNPGQLNDPAGRGGRGIKRANARR